MSRSRRFFAVLAFSTFLWAALAPAQQYAQPGKFDLYLFTLSWSPQFCATTKRDVAECQLRGGNFVVHGLWPEFKNGSWPSDCSREPGPANPSTFADLMPDASLLSHEWYKHGTCSALGVDGYFSLMRRVGRSILIPDRFLRLNHAASMAPSDVKASFIAKNPQLRAEDMRIGCANNTLVQVQICLGKDGTPTTCGTIRDCRASSIKVLPTLQ